VGVCSYLLISFWFTRTQANVSSLKAFLVNRVGDFGFIIALAIFFTVFTSTDFTLLFSIAPTIVTGSTLNIFGYLFSLLNCVALLLFVGVMSKSAQLFLHVWLPDAMEGPTPVSALIHAATMVAAGVFLLARCSPIFALAPSILFGISLIGAFTAFVAATIGFFQSDIRKIIAYSTCSQLGYMVLAAGLGSIQFSIFHLINHAFFKALLFLVSGSIIHAISDIQDIRRFGALRFFLPFTYITLLIGSIALSGLPFLSGFFSKDPIIELSLLGFKPFYNFCSYLALGAAFLTALYSTRLILVAFFLQNKMLLSLARFASESSSFIFFSLLALSIPSIFFGFFFTDRLSSMPFDFYSSSIAYFSPSSSLDLEFLPVRTKLMSFILTLFGIFISIYLFGHRVSEFSHLIASKAGIFVFFSKKWYFDQLYNYYLAFKVFTVSYKTFLKRVDKGILETLGGEGLKFLFNSASVTVGSVNRGVFNHYLFYIIISSLLGLISSVLLWFKLYVVLAIGLAFVFFDFCVLSTNRFFLPLNFIAFTPFKTFFNFPRVKRALIYVENFFAWAYLAGFTLYCYAVLVWYIFYMLRYKTHPFFPALL
jgi:proton-translocating NADH-quinone oxidoreductase chain L